MTRKKRKHLAHGRSQIKRTRKRRILIVTNGEVTEPMYFEMLEQIFPEVTFTIKTHNHDPENLALDAADAKKWDDENSYDKGYGKSSALERTFVVTDVDCFTASQLFNAQKTCNRNKMNLVISNPCFELWLLDHVEIVPESMTLSSHVEARAKSKGLTTGHRNKAIVEDILINNIDDAVNNAKAHMRNNERAKKRQHLHTIDFAP